MLLLCPFNEHCRQIIYLQQLIKIGVRSCLSRVVNRIYTRLINLRLHSFYVFTILHMHRIVVDRTSAKLRGYQYLALSVIVVWTIGSPIGIVGSVLSIVFVSNNWESFRVRTGKQ